MHPVARRVRSLFENRAALSSALYTVVAVRCLLWTSGMAAAERFVASGRFDPLGDDFDPLGGNGEASNPRDGVAAAPSLEAMRVVAWSVSATARVVPRATCLTQALAGQALLRRRGVSSSIRIGVRPQGERLSAHAWLVCGSTIVLGGAEQLALHSTIREVHIRADA